MIGLVGATFMIGAMAPVSAAPVLLTAQVAGSDNVVPVRNDRWDRRGNGNWNGHRPGRQAGTVTAQVVRAGTAIIVRARVIGMAIVAITIIAMAIVVTMTVGGIRWQPSVLARSLVALSRSQRLSRFIDTATTTFSGAIIVTDHTARRTIRSSLTTVRVSCAIRLTVDKLSLKNYSRLKRAAVLVWRETLKTPMRSSV